MKILQNLKYVLIIICLYSCVVRRLMNQKDNIYWTGVNKGKTYDLYVTDTKNNWFNAIILIDKIDTIFVKGYEKGRQNLCKYKLTETDSIYEKRISIWVEGHNAETVYIDNKRDKDTSVLPLELYLVKKKL